MTIPHLDIVVSALSALVYVLLILKTRLAFVLGLANQGFWAALMVQTHSYGLTYSICFFTIVNVIGFWRWTKSPPAGRKECACVQ